MNVLIVSPHQDDEMIGCYSVMKHFGSRCMVVTCIKGGGHPKGIVVPEEELYQLRLTETKTACRQLGVSAVFDLGIPRNELTCEEVERRLLYYIESINPSIIFTTFPEDNHPEHNIVGLAVKNLYRNSYGFLVQTDKLKERLSSLKPDICIKLSDLEYLDKARLIDLYSTQKHFLPNVIRRKEYQIETFWRI